MTEDDDAILRAKVHLRDHHLPDDDLRLVACVAAAIRAAVQRERGAYAEKFHGIADGVRGVREKAIWREAAETIRGRKP